MEFLDKGFREPVFDAVNDVVNAAEVVSSLYNIIYIDPVFRGANRVGLENVPGLLVGKPVALDVVGVIGQVNLGAMINAAADFTLFFFSESLEKRRGFLFAPAAHRLFSIGRQTPSLAHEKRSGNLPGRTPVPHSSLRKTMSFGKFSD